MGEELSSTLNQDLNLDPNPEVDLEVEIAADNARSDWNRLPVFPETHIPESPLPVAAEGCNGTKVKEEDSDESFFDCSICLNMSKEPVVTNCGHLYCWSCLNQWIQVSLRKECLCPVCKGKVSVETLTPIYGSRKRKSEEVSNTLMIPSRPQARRVERSRTTLENSNDYRRVRYTPRTLRAARKNQWISGYTRTSRGSLVILHPQPFTFKSPGWREWW